MMTGGEPMVLLLVVVILGCGDDGAMTILLMMMTMAVMCTTMVSKDTHRDYVAKGMGPRECCSNSQQNADTRLQKLERLRNSGNRGAVDG